MFMSLSVTPHNPRHFIALCFLFVKDHPEFKDNNKLSKKVWEKGNVAVFKCSYGFFLIDKNNRISKEFSSDLKNLVSKVNKPPHLGEG